MAAHLLQQPCHTDHGTASTLNSLINSQGKHPSNYLASAMSLSHFLSLRRLNILGALLLIACTHALTTLADFVIPSGSGPYNTTLQILELVDSGRLDPFNSTHRRRLMISRFDPLITKKCGQTEFVPYFPPIVSTTEDNILAPFDFPAGVWNKLQLQVCKPTDHESNDELRFLPVVFSPGFNTTRLWYNILAQEIASYGYTVITVDHPYETDVVQFPDGTVIYGGAVVVPTPDNSSTASIEHALEVRAADISFVLDTLGASKALMFGHSFGGAATATSMLHDARILGGVNLDGSMFGPVLTDGFHHPSAPGQSFLLWGSEGHNTTSDANWGQFWKTISGESPNEVAWKRELKLKGGLHGSWWDLNVVVDVVGIRESLTSLAQELVSPVKGRRAYEITGVYLKAFFEMVLTGKMAKILETDSAEYPEVKILQ